MAIRQPIVAIVGHIDHGKTTLLDKIRGTTIAQKEAGAITQHIGATELPMDTIKNANKGLFEKMKLKTNIPGLLLIDTPGHESFSNLRKRGGSISDIAILVVDLNEGFKAQTREALEILRSFKVPFIIAANKVDLVNNWKYDKDKTFIENLNQQREFTKEELDEKIYRIVIALSDYSLESERFDRVSDYTKQIAIIPCSGLTGEGIPELLTVIVGLAQKYLEKELQVEVSGPARGTILEIKEEKGMGKTIDVILYDGTIKKGDTIIMPGLTEPIITKVRALLKPCPMKEMREKSCFQNIDSVSAASGIKISAPKLDNALAGMPIWGSEKEDDNERIASELQSEIKSILISSDQEGCIIKSDSIGAIEALTDLFKKIDLPIRRASLGELSKSDIVEAKGIKEKNPLIGVIFTFNVKIPKEVEEFAKESEVKIFSSNIIYTLYEHYQEWKLFQEEEKRKQAETKIIWPAKVKVLKGFVFRQSDPAIVGVEVLTGKLRTKTRLINIDGREVGEVKQVQAEGKSIGEAARGERVAISIPGAVVGRNLYEDAVLYTFIPKSNVEMIESEFIESLSSEDVETLQEFKRITRS